jgi:hypothetical protein
MLARNTGPRPGEAAVIGIQRYRLWSMILASPRQAPGQVPPEELPAPIHSITATARDAILAQIQRNIPRLILCSIARMESHGVV